MIDYIIDGQNLRTTFGIYVSESTGIVDVPELKERQSVDWAEYNGEFIDDSQIIFKSKDISLKCVQKASSASDMITKINQIRDLLAKSGCRRLEIKLSSTTSLYYDVILNGSINFNKKWRESSDFVSEFNIKLKECEPVKMVLDYTPAESATTITASLNITSEKSVSIYWGDGSVSQDIYGTQTDVEHTYSTSGTYIIIIHGDIDNFTLNNSNTTTLWSKLL